MILIFINIILDEMEKMNVGTLINDVRSFILDKGKKIIKFIKKNSIFLSGMIVCLLIILFYAMSAGHYVDFFPTNGTFQNYNPVRRFLNGQVPYKDFQDYLGLGHLYIGSLITLLFGGTFRASLIAFSFLTMLGFALIIFVVAKVIFKKKETAIALTNIMLVLLIVNPPFFRNSLVIMDELYTSIRAALNVGNSARFIRGLIVPISCGMLWLGKRIIDKGRMLEINWKYSVMVGIVAGFSFIWSNDYGISCWLCITIVYFWFYFCEKRIVKEAFINTFIELVVSLCAIVCFIEIFTWGNLSNWLQATFGTGGYQGWYYNTKEKSYFLWDIDTSFVVLFQMGICIFYLIRMFLVRVDNENKVKNMFLAYGNMVGVCALQEYKLLSGGNSKEVAFSILFATILFEMANFILNKIDINKMKYLTVVLSFIGGVALVISLAKKEFEFWLITEKEGIYIEEMDGNLTLLGEDLIKTEKFLQGDGVFATYASAQELMLDTFQPSGIDYIIHVLGDTQRDNYLSELNNQDFKYVATIKESYTSWEYWSQRANWFFYRELYSHWHPVFANSYELYWEKNDESEQNVIKKDFNINVKYVDDATVVIAIKCDARINGVADLYIDYSVKKQDSKWSLFIIQELLHIKNTGKIYTEDPYFDSNYLRSESKEYVPVLIVDGYGEITLTSEPEKFTYIELKDYSCDTIYTVASDYVEIIGISEEMSGDVVHVALTEKNKDSILNAQSLIYGDNTYDIKDVNYNNGQINIIINGSIELNDKNMIKIK